MAKTASQIVAERKEVSDYRNAVHEKQMAEVGAKAAARTAAVLNAAGHQTTINPQTYEVSIVGTTTPKTTEQKKLDLQHKKETQAEAKTKNDAIYNKYHTAKKQYEDYLKSDEHRQRLEEADRKQRERKTVNLFLPNADMQEPEIIQDEKEISLRAAMNAAEAEVNAEADRKVVEFDLEAITGLSNEERKELEQYSVNQIRDQNLPVEFQNNPFMKTAEQEASGLIGKIGKQRADELAETYMRQQNAALARQAAASGAKAAGTGFWSGLGASVGTVPINVAAGLVGSVGQLQGAARNTGRYQTLDPNATGTALQTYTGAVRGQVQQNIEGEDPNFWRKAASIGYQGLMSAADSVAQAYLGGGAFGGATLAATNSFSQTMAEASRQGATPAQAAFLATVNSGIEALSEAIPLDNLIKTAKGQGLNTVLKNALRQAGIEAITEEISMIGTVLAETAILQEKSSYRQDIINGILGGMSPDDAIMQANINILEEAKNTAFVSMISGGASSLGGSYADARGLPVPPTIQELAEIAQDTAYNQQTVNKEPQQPAQTAEPVVAEKETVAQQQNAEPEKNLSDVMADVFRELQEKNGKVSNRMAETVMADPAAMQKLGVTSEGTKAEQRRTVKAAIEQQYEMQNTQPETQTAPVKMPTQAKETSDQATMQASAPTTDMQMGATNQSAEGGQIKGTGAAEVDFSGKPSYNAILSEDNAQPDRKTDVRPMELPARDIDDNPISATTANVYGSQNTPDDLAAAMEEPVARGDFSYVRITNDKSTQKAQKVIQDAGSWEAAAKAFATDVAAGNAGAVLSARGALILNHAADVYQQAKESGDTKAAQAAKKNWLSILSDVQKLGTNTAQGLQAFKIIRNLMPQDKLEFAKATVINMARDLDADIQIDETLLNEYENATTDQQRNEVMEKIQQNVADQVPATKLDKWNALRYTNMLGNLKTNVRNVEGNLANTFIFRFKDGTGAILEAVANKVSGGKVGRTKSLVVNKQLEKAMDTYYQQVKNVINNGGKYSDRTAAGDFEQGVMDKRTIFKFKPLESYRKATEWMMNNRYFGDEAFSKAAFTRSMAGYLQANGVKNPADIQNASDDLIDKAMTYALKEAQEITFKDNTVLANVFGKIKKASGIVGEGIIPFTKTPANVLVRAEEFSPLGIINTAVKAAQAANPNSDVTGTDVINSLSKTITGTAVFALGAFLKNAGILNGGPDDDEEQAAFDKMNGIQPYSINLPDGTTYTLDWLTPVAMPLFMGAQLAQIASEKELTFADLEEVLTSITDPMIQMSMMQGINSSLEDIRYSGNNGGQFFMNAAVNYLMQGLTNTLLGQIERSTEENRQTTYIDKDSQVPEWAQRALGKASQKIPGWDYQQTDYVDAWGQKQKNEGGLGYNLLSPGYSSKKKSDAVTEELNRLRESTGENVFPDSAEKKITYTDKQGTEHVNYSLSDEQYQTLAQKQGQIARELWEDVVKSRDYAAMTDAEKAKVSSEIKSYAKKTGEIAAIGDSHTGYSESWMMDVKKKGADEIVRKTFTSSINGAMSNLGNAWEQKYDEAAFIRDMETVFDSFRNASKPMQKQVLDSLNSNAEIYVESRKGGIASDKVLGLQKTIATAKPEAETKSVGQKQEMDIIANFPGLTNEQRRLLGKLYGTTTQDENIDEVANIIRAAKADGKKVPAVDTFKLYAQLYRDHADYTHGNGKRDRTLAHWQQKYGMDYNTAMQLYKAFS